MDDNIVLLKSSKLIERLKMLNSKVEDIIDCILEKAGVQSQDIYVMLKKASRQSIVAKNLIYTNSVITIDIEKNEKHIRTYTIPGYFAERENKIYIQYGSLFQFCGECGSAKHIISCSLGVDVGEKYNKIESYVLKEDNKEEIGMHSEGENMIGDDKTVERTSLCMVTEHSGQIWLSRLADINNKNRLTSFYFDEDAPKVFDNRNRLYWKNGPDEIGYVGVWSWIATPRNTDYELDYIESTYMLQYDPIELIIFSEEHDLEFVIEQIKAGYILKATPSQVFFCIRMGKGLYRGVLCKAKDLVKVGDLYRVGENIVSLPQYTISSVDILRVEDRVFYKEFSMGEPEKKLIIREIYEIIRETLLRRVSWSSMKLRGMNKNEWKQFKGFISELVDDSLYQEIAESCECSEEIAKQYIDDFVSNANKFIDGQDIDSQILETIVENSEKLKKRCEEIISQQWIDNHQKEIEDAEKELQTVKNQMNSEVDETKRKKEVLEKDILEKKEVLAKIDVNIEKANEKLSELEQKIEQYEELGNEVREKVSKRIEEAKKNVADFICERAFCAPIPTLQPIETADKSKVQSAYTVGLVSQNELDVAVTWQELIDILSEELREAGITDDLVVDFAIYLYAANKNNMPILLAGPCGVSIANAFSMALYGKKAGILDCNKEYQSDEIDRMLNGEDEVVIIKNPFSAAWVNCITECLIPARKQYFLLTPYAEDLLIEPNGLLNYMMPVLTEVLVDKIPTNQFVGGKMAVSFKHFVKKDAKVNSYIRVFKEFSIKRLAAERLQNIIEMYHGMSDKDVSDIDYLMVLLPCAYIMEQGDLLLDYMDKAKKLSNTMKGIIKSFLGENE